MIKIEEDSSGDLNIIFRDDFSHLHPFLIELQNRKLRFDREGICFAVWKNNIPLAGITICLDELEQIGKAILEQAKAWREQEK
jgi:hypothetical protein